MVRNRRTVLVKEMAATGMSTRAIADVVGVSHMTVKRDLADQVEHGVTPAPEPEAEGDMPGDDPAPAVEHGAPAEPKESQATDRVEAVQELKAKGLTDEQVAAQLGVSTKTVQRVKVDIAEKEKEAAPKTTGKDGKQYPAAAGRSGRPFLQG